MVDSKQMYEELSDLSAEIARCGRCGFCQSVCPVYQVSADESGVARGRIMYAKGLVSGELGFSRRNEAFFSECLLCRACVDTCFSGVRTDEIVVAGRRTLTRIQGLSPVYRHIFERLLPDHHRFGRFIRLAGTMRRMVPDQIVGAMRMFGWLGRSMERSEQLLQEVPDEFLRERLSKRENARTTMKQAALFIGCGTNFMFPHVGEATVEVLEMLGYETLILEHGCCGLPAYAHGALQAAQVLARKNIEEFAKAPDSIIVTDCSSCASFLKEYPRILSMGEERGQIGASEAESFASRVRDLTELLGDRAHVFLSARTGHRHAQKGENMGSVPGIRVTFHDPCHLSRYQRQASLARDVLRSLPGIDFIEMKEADWCCGGAGAFAVEHADLSLKILERKTRNVKASMADTVITTCPSCLMQLRSGLRDSGSRIRAIHLVELVRERIGIAIESASL